jgi:hypothetical protein
MRTANHESHGPMLHGTLGHWPPAWVIAAGMLAIGAANLALIVAVAAGRFG